MHSAHVDITDTGQAIDALETYFPGVNLGSARAAAGFHFAIDAYSNGQGLTFLDYAVGGREMTTHLQDASGYMVSSVRMDGSAAYGDTPVDRMLPFITRSGLHSQYSHAEIRGISLSEEAMDNYLRTRPGRPTKGPFRFTGTAPRTLEHALVWRNLAATVRTAMQSGLTEDPFLREAMETMVAECLLSCFPNNWDDTRHTDPFAATSAVRRARSFIDDHSQEAISVNQIAEAARLSVSGLQHAFRTEYGLTPTAYLRHVRLEHARRALLEGDPTASDTVAAIARAAGFTHAPRFAAAYRQRYGENPRDTLRK